MDTASYWKLRQSIISTRQFLRASGTLAIAAGVFGNV